jgi:hypothetical protein
MTLSKVYSDGPEWMLYDKDLSNAMGLAILHPLDPKIYLKLNDCGSGEMSLPLSDPVLSQIQIGQFIGLNYRGDFRGGFFIEKIRLIEANSQERPGLTVGLSGRGVLALLDEGIVWDWGTPDLENTRFFGTKDVTMTYGGAPVSKGKMVFHLLDEAENHQDDSKFVDPQGQTLDRFVWHRGGLLAGPICLDWDFTAGKDSDGNNWTDTGDYEYRVGTSLLDVIRQVGALEYDFTVTRDAATGLFMLHAYPYRVGTDVSSTVHFRVGMDVTEVSREEAGAEIKNTILVEFSDPSNPYTTVQDATSVTAYRRRESLLQASNASTHATAVDYGTSEVNNTKDPTHNIAIKVSDTPRPFIFIDYDLGDTVSYDNARTPETTYRVTGAQLSWAGDNKYADVVLEME